MQEKMRYFSKLKSSLFLIPLLIASCSQSNKKNDASKRWLATEENQTDVSPGQTENKESSARPGKQAERYIYDGEPKKLLRAFLNTTLKDPEGSKIIGVGVEREEMAKYNLHNTGLGGDLRDPEESKYCEDLLKKANPNGSVKGPFRTPNGECYLYGVDDRLASKYRMAAKGTRFGRNTAPKTMSQIKKIEDNLDKPNPRLISKKLFTRENGTIEAKTINLLATAWLQAENHDWFSHGKNPTPSDRVDPARRKDIDSHPRNLTPEQEKLFQPLEFEPIDGEADQAFKTKGKDGLKVFRTMPDFSKTPRRGFQRTFRNTVTHWWDASHIYGSDQKTINHIRTVPPQAIKKEKDNIDANGFYKGGLIAVDEENRRLYYEGPEGDETPITGFHDNWWSGLELIHTLFALEHNFVARELAKQNPGWSSDQLFHKSRMIIAALIAKIHSVEWTPALLDNPALHISMHMNWYGLGYSLGPLRGKKVFKMMKDYYEDTTGNSSPLTGYIGKNTLEYFNVPFTLTEEFVSVYRMHPLVPDFIYHYKFGPDKVKRIGDFDIRDTREEKAFTVIEPNSENRKSIDWLYSFGKSHPGAMTLNNYPAFMQNLKVKRNTLGKEFVTMDLAAMDIIRDRERQVPRYNEFRRALRLKPITKFRDLFKYSDDMPIEERRKKDRQVQALREVYNDPAAPDVDRVELLDLLVGSLAEDDRFENFGFGNTPFYIFALMAPRRMMTDPFLSDYFTEEHYTKWGLDLVQNKSMKEVILTHFKELAPRLEGVTNAFQPWN